MSVNRGETSTGERSEEAPTAMHENERSGARISTSWVSPGWSRNLNFSNRPVRTRMPGGVAGIPGVMIRGPYADHTVGLTGGCGAPGSGLDGVITMW